MPAASQPIMSYYALELDGHGTLIHTSGDRFQFLIRSEELLFIDPLRKKERLVAYSVQREAVLVTVDRQSSVNDEVQRTYYILNVPQKRRVGPLSVNEFKAELASLSLPEASIQWEVPTEPHPGFKLLFMIYFSFFVVVLVLGYILPLPFLVMLWYYGVLKKRLQDIQATQKSVQRQS